MLIAAFASGRLKLLGSSCAMGSCTDSAEAVATLIISDDGLAMAFLVSSAVQQGQLHHPH
jgi:hypothetical protein